MTTAQVTMCSMTLCKLESTFYLPIPYYLLPNNLTSSPLPLPPPKKKEILSQGKLIEQQTNTINLLN